MCRILSVKSSRSFQIEEHLRPFAQMCQASKEFQGHGWGCAFVRNEKWEYYKNIQPIWEEDLTPFGETTELLVHARSAFQDEGIVIENNMPFFDDRYVFIFNGELRGVKIKAEGRIGAEKIFNYLKRFDQGDFSSALDKGVKVIEKRTRYVRAMNMIVSDQQSTYVSTLFNEDPDYFQMYYKEGEPFLICSQPYPGETDWIPLENNTIKVF